MTFALRISRWYCVLVLCVALMAMASVANAGAIYVWDFQTPPPQGPTIQELVDEFDGKIQVGDKIFTFYNDSVSTAATIGTVAPNAAEIRVAGVSVPGDGLGNDLGLRFNGGWSAGGAQIADSTILFQVEVAEPERSGGIVIHDNSLWMGAYGVSDDGTGLVAISENVYAFNPRTLPPPLNPSIADKFVYYRNENDKMIYDHQVFGTEEDPVGLPSIWVLKDVVVNGGSLQTGAAHISEFYQTFSQIYFVPEPATLSLLVLGGLGMAGSALRRRRAGR
jgi:hypothetical protein